MKACKLDPLSLAMPWYCWGVKPHSCTPLMPYTYNITRHHQRAIVTHLKQLRIDGKLKVFGTPGGPLNDVCFVPLTRIWPKKASTSKQVEHSYQVVAGCPCRTCLKCCLRYPNRIYYTRQNFQWRPWSPRYSLAYRRALEGK